MKRRVLCLLATLITGLWICRAETITVAPEKSVIVTLTGTNDAKAVKASAVAAGELAKHLELITGADIEIVNETNFFAGEAQDNSSISAKPCDLSSEAIRAKEEAKNAVLPVPASGQGVLAKKGKYPFYVGLPMPGDNKPFAPEEARRAVTPEATWLYGDANNGALFAVYGFLEDELGVRWIEPGDAGIACRRQSPLALTTGAHSWAPALGFRGIRSGGSKDEDILTWRKRMRMGGHLGLNYGHSFTTWWLKYGKAHPEYFAMKKDGKREPENVTGYKPKAMYTDENPKGFQNIKLCPSNPKVADQIVENWLPSSKRQKTINVCENDSPPVNFCTCTNCVALDVVIKGQEGLFGQHLTDRYVYLANMVARKAREHDPEACAVMYAYNEAEQPPRREKLEPNVVIGFVPTTSDLSKLKQLFNGWRAAGATKMFLRPNLHGYYFTTAIPMGFEKQFYDVFQTAYREGTLLGTDYDSLVGMWPVTGIADYIQAHSFADPSKPFEYWEDHYCAAYGPAAADVKRYFQYWRNEVWEKRLKPEIEDITLRGRWFNFYRGMVWSLGKYYKPEDFNKTDAILQEALKKDLSDPDRARVEQLAMANRHARLFANAVIAQGVDRQQPSLDLLEFRENYKDELRLSWGAVSYIDRHFKDIAGVEIARTFKEYPLPWLLTDLSWRFKLDPQDVGVKENWPGLSYDRILKMKDWEPMRTSNYWEQPYEFAGSAELKEKLKDYDGIAWYATQSKIPPDWKDRKVLLYFWAVDGSARVYVNGREAGQRLCEKAGDESAPFTIRIDQCLDWSKNNQQISVRIEDRKGLGGIWKRVWIVSEAQDKAGQ